MSTRFNIFCLTIPCSFLVAFDSILCRGRVIEWRVDAGPHGEEYVYRCKTGKKSRKSPLFGAVVAS